MVWGLVLALGLHVLAINPAGAQSTQVDTEPVFLAGTYLFDVPAAGDLTAPERALAVETNLAPLLEISEPVVVHRETRPVQRDGETQQLGNPIILANDRYIMTVTSADASIGRGEDPQEQAEIWAATLQETLTKLQAERQPGFWRQAILRSLAALAVALALHWLAGKLWHTWFKPLAHRLSLWPEDLAEDEVTGLKLLFRLSLFLIRGAVWFITLAYIADLFPLTRRLSFLMSRSLREGLFARNLLLGDRPYSLLDLLLLMVVLLGLVILASALTNVLRSRFLRITGVSLAAQEAIAVLSKYTLILLGTVVILQLWGIDLSSIALIASGLGIGVGLGLQGLVKDFVSGLVMVFERPVQVGDFVDFGDVKGTIARIGSRSTEIRTLDQVSIIVPNSRFLDAEVVNWSHGNPISRIRLPVGVAYKSDPLKVKDALLEACETNQDILSVPAPQVFFLGFGDSALSFQLLVWIAQPNRQLIIKSDLYFAIEASLRRHAIEIPFPQRDLHIRSGYLPIAASAEAQQVLGKLGNLSEESNGL
ncbi:mechanosensitive ion channel domain-containing protein [Nodosilinea sp. P-1105]|uniref:mechanosensitive ion channel family protein n=1 Tax=Nodosilinea sp. P-1105 TaxID=2546229 RepID=UPI00146D7BFF|nr:mechanosensitive ion channel domain-containing protein [Nodosilinea sp. P-1105]NMF85279.1 mechanosensitive ion channel [Nodosilinea sp. P-1105]